MSNSLYPDIEIVVEEIMARQGWNIEDNPLEFDKNNKDSQISILREGVLEVFEVLEDLDQLDILPCDECEGSDILIINHECVVELDQD